MSDLPLDPGIRVEAQGSIVVLSMPGWPSVAITTDQAVELEISLHLESEKAGHQRRIEEANATRYAGTTENGLVWLKEYEAKQAKLQSWRDKEPML